MFFRTGCSRCCGFVYQISKTVTYKNFLNCRLQSVSSSIDVNREKKVLLRDCEELRHNLQLHRALSSAATSAEENPKKQLSGQLKKRDKLDLTFSDAEQAFRSKTTSEVLRAYIVFKLCGFNYIVENNMMLMNLGKTVLGKRLFGWLMELTFYGHFVAGADEKAIQPKLARLQDFGVKPILDYSVEEDLSNDQANETDMKSFTPFAGEPEKEYQQFHPQSTKFGDRRTKAACRTYFYLNEASCERNMNVFIKSCEAVSESGFVAIKLTALGRPQLLMQLSEAIARVQRYVTAFTGKSGSVANQDLKPSDFQRKLERAAKTDPTVQSWLDNITSDSSGVIHILPWKNVVGAHKRLAESLKVADLNTGQMKNLVPPLSDEEEEMFKNMMRRVHTIFKMAEGAGKRVMVDAEQSYFQPAIRRITMEMMQIYNRERTTVYNTYQCYLKHALSDLTTDLKLAERQNIFFGAKLVRGAYLEQERTRAEEIGYLDPTNPTFEATSEMYRDCLLESMRRVKLMKEKGRPVKILIMAATHNEDTIRFAIEKMKEYGIKRSDRIICFGQLYGMSDNLSFPLGQSGYSVFKYVPYGPVTEVLPYLSRRAQENKGMFKKVDKERRLLLKELFRRVRKGQIMYKPRVPRYSVAWYNATWNCGAETAVMEALNKLFHLELFL